MPTPRRHLLLPSDKGLVHYDLLEETVFLGVGAKGAILASPTPFPEAKLLLADDGRGLVARALPGEAAPEVDGVASEGGRLSDGSRVRVGGQIVLLRSPEGVVAPPTIASAPMRAARAPRAAPDPSATAARKSAGLAARVLGFSGAALLLFAAYQTVHYLDTKGPDPVPPITASMFVDPPVVRSTPEEQAHAEFERLAASDTGDLTKLADLFDGYVALAKSGRGTAAGERAALRAAELRPGLATFLLPALERDVESAAKSARYRTALALLQGFEQRFAGTDAAATIPDKIAAVRTQARDALDALARRVAPIMAKDATRAYRLLTTTTMELPTDLAEELAALMARVRDLWSGPGKPPPPEPVRPPTPPAPDAPTPPAPPTPPPTAPRPKDGGGAFGGRPTHPESGPSQPATPRVDQEAAAKAAWVAAREHLAARRFAEAKDAYAKLAKEYGSTEVAKSHPERWKAGRKAAEVGLRGPVGFLREEAVLKDGKLECEWSFDDDRAFLEDFDVVQAFEGVEPAQCEIRSGMAILSGSTAILVNVVFEPSSVIWEADCVADAHKDYGLFALQESKAWRSLALEVGNTQFSLKKGAAAKVLAGHILWLFGDGVWRDADPGTRGFVRLAEQLGNSLKGGERLRLDLEVLGDRVEGAIHSKNDPAILKAPLKGDDGKGMTSMRVGAFTHKGRVGVERLRVSGKVDEGWALQEFQRLVAADTGPD